MAAALAGAVGLALLLGMRHGTDVDHLSTIDSLVRAQSSSHPRAAHWAGLWFSAGHGLAVFSAAAGMVAQGRTSQLSDTWETVGVMTAVGVLVLLGWSNLRSACSSASARRSLRQGVTRWFTARWPASPAAFALGLLFALSFDALSLSLMFATMARHEGPVGLSLLGAAFTTGMLVVDGLTGWCSAWMLKRSHRLSPHAGRITGALLGAGSLATAALLVLEHQEGGVLSAAQRLGASAAVLLLVPLGLFVSWRSAAGPAHADMRSKP